MAATYTSVAIQQLSDTSVEVQVPHDVELQQSPQFEDLNHDLHAGRHFRETMLIPAPIKVNAMIINVMGILR